MKTRTRSVVCWVEAGFDALGVAGFCQVLSDAGSIWNWRAYRIAIVSRSGGSILSNAQQELVTVPVGTVEPDVVVVASGHDVAPASHFDATERWTSPDIDWIGLRAGLLPVMRTGRFPNAVVAANVRLQPRLLAVEPSLRFSTKPWHVDGKLWSCASADATEVALNLVQRHVGNSARRAVETSLGLATTFSAVNVELVKLGKPGA